MALVKKSSTEPHSFLPPLLGNACFFPLYFKSGLQTVQNSCLLHRILEMFALKARTAVLLSGVYIWRPRSEVKPRMHIKLYQDHHSSWLYLPSFDSQFKLKPLIGPLISLSYICIWDMLSDHLWRLWGSAGHSRCGVSTRPDSDQCVIRLDTCSPVWHLAPFHPDRIWDQLYLPVVAFIYNLMRL